MLHKKSVKSNALMKVPVQNNKTIFTSSFHMTRKCKSESATSLSSLQFHLKGSFLQKTQNNFYGCLSLVKLNRKLFMLLITTDYPFSLFIYLSPVTLIVQFQHWSTLTGKIVLWNIFCSNASCRPSIYVEINLLEVISHIFYLSAVGLLHP